MDFDRIRAFIAVSDEGGISAAARRLGQSKSLISKQISDLEESLGLRLFQRTTRSLSLTTSGERFYGRIFPLMAELNDVFEEVTGEAGEARGHLRITTPVSFGLAVANGCMASFMTSHPEIRIDLHASDFHEDLAGRGFDLAIRVGHLADSSLIASKISETKMLVCASPDYLNRQGTPQKIDDFGDHACLIYANAQAGNRWDFWEGGQLVRQRIKPRLAANNGDNLCMLAEEGLGIVMLPEFIVAHAINRGSLVRITGPWTLDVLGVHAVMSERRMMTWSLRLLLDHLKNDIPKRLKNLVQPQTQT